MELSVITVNKNNCEGLRRTIESVVNQICNNYEYIIIDGDSSDKSVEVIKSYDRNLSYWESEKDTGIYNAMNKAIRKARGKYCLFLNSGDYLYDEKTLDSVINDLNNNDIVYGNIVVFDSKQKHFITYPEELTLKDFYLSSIPHSGGSFIKRELFEKFGFYNETYKIVSDWEFFIKSIVFGNVSTLHVDYFISYFDLEGVSTQNQQLMHTERQKVLEDLIPPKILIDYDKNIVINNSITDIPYSKLCLLLIKKIIPFD